jgi:hypothetical protein
MPVGHKVWYYVKLTKIKNNKLMELLVFFFSYFDSSFNNWNINGRICHCVQIISKNK